MKKKYKFVEDCKDCWKNDLWLKVLTITSVALIISSFIVPPLGIIDGSVLAAVGELSGLGALWEFTKAMKKNIDAKVKIKEIELELNNNKEDDDPADEQSEI